VPGLHGRRQVDAVPESSRDDREQQADQARPSTGLAPDPRVRVSRGGSWSYFGSGNANEFYCDSADFNEFFMTIRILTISKPETCLI
jgi:hypothetical protein